MAYIALKDLRDEGISDPPYTDAWVTERISLAQFSIREIYGRFFEKRTLTLTLDGRGHNTLWLPIPPVSVTAITKVTVADVEVDSADYRVIMPSFPDGRGNPKLFKIAGVWTAGESNIEVKGDFGFVEADETTPPLIQDACKRIAVAWMPQIGDAEGQRASQIIAESLKDYSYQLNEKTKVGLFGDPAIDNILAQFRRNMIGTY